MQGAHRIIFSWCFHNDTRFFQVSFFTLFTWNATRIHFLFWGLQFGHGGWGGGNRLQYFHRVKAISCWIFYSYCLQPLHFSLELSHFYIPKGIYTYLTLLLPFCFYICNIWPSCIYWNVFIYPVSMNDLTAGCNSITAR